MGDLVIAANRAPVKLFKTDDGRLEVRHGSGGLAPSLASALYDKKVDWVATALSDEDISAARDQLPIDTNDINVKFVVLPEKILELSYSKVANETLWFLYHGMFNLAYNPSFDKSFFASWDAFRMHNQKIAEEICENANYGATVIVHDYHFALVGKYLKEHRSDLKTAYFLHTPFPSIEEIQILPMQIAKEILSSMCDFGTCGFHTKRWMDRFSQAAELLLAAKPKAFAAPLGVSKNALVEAVQSEAVRSQAETLIEKLDGKKLIYRTDRMEPSKNLLRGFLAFEEFLDNNPSLRGEVLFVARSYLSREKSSQYQIYRKAVVDKVKEINEKFGSSDPVIELILEDNYEASLAAMLCYDVLLVNPIRDGMNLVAKEGPAVNEKNGAVVLSREAGAYEEMEGLVLAVNPYDVSETAQAIYEGLTMSEDEKAKRQTALRKISLKGEPSAWISALIAEARVSRH